MSVGDSNIEYFEGNDLALIESLQYVPALKPYFDEMRYCLVWEDEFREPGLTRDGYEKLCDLWIMRSYIHRKIPLSEHPTSGQFYVEQWDRVNKAKFRWPGFYRMELSDSDEQYLLAAIDKANSD